MISGYLISATTLSEVQENRFSIVGFYERRIRRIFPALLVMLLATSVAAYLFLLPPQTESFAVSMLSALFSVSNILFWRQSGYFDEVGVHKPLLHTWSLGVEEQFYIFFPLLILAIHRWKPRWMQASVWTLTAVTFLAAIAFVRLSPSAAFFWSPLRAWELLIGTVLSQKYLPALQGARWREVASVTGLLLILIPAFRYSSLTPFPGLAAMPPCVGAALIIAAGETGTSAVGRLLSWRPAVFIGTISYSLYLWHWPLISFRYDAKLLPDLYVFGPYARVGLSLASLILATLSWRFVETPFRKGTWRPSRSRLFLITGSVAAVVLLVGFWMQASGGLPSRFSKQALHDASYMTYDPAVAWRQDSCFLMPKDTFAAFQQATCLADDPSRKHMLIFGDSLAAHLYPGLKAIFPEVNFSEATSAACLQLLGNQREQFAAYTPNCRNMSRFFYSGYFLHHQLDAVLYAGSWEKQDLPEIERAVQWFHQHGIKVILFGPVPTYSMYLPRLLAYADRAHDPTLIQSHFSDRLFDLDRQMQSLAKERWHVPYISGFEDLCTPQGDAYRCPLYAEGGVPMEFDNHHFTVEGSLAYARAIRARRQLPLVAFDQGGYLQVR